MARTPVFLNVYDMYWLNEYASNLGVGVFHSGIEIYGIGPHVVEYTLSQYAYGGHPLPFSGIFENSPKDANELGENFKFRESIVVGETDFSADEVKKMISLMGEEYRGDRYHLISKNCNHFSSTLAKTLSGNDIPSWVNRLASISGSIPFLERWIPQEWLTPIALKQSLDSQTPIKNSMSSNGGAFGSNDSRQNAYKTSSSNSADNSNVWKFFQRRSSNTTPLDSACRSVPITARSVDNGVVSSNGTSSQPLSRLWASIKNMTSLDNQNSTTGNAFSPSSSRRNNNFQSFKQ